MFCSNAFTGTPYASVTNTPRELTCKSSEPKAADIVQVFLVLLFHHAALIVGMCPCFEQPMPVAPAPILTYSYSLWLILQPSTSHLQLQFVAGSAAVALLTYNCRSLMVVQPSTPDLQLVSGSAAKHPSPTTTAHCWFCSQALLTETAHAICCTSCALQQHYVHLAGVAVQGC